MFPEDMRDLIAPFPPSRDMDAAAAQDRETIRRLRNPQVDAVFRRSGRWEAGKAEIADLAIRERMMQEALRSRQNAMNGLPPVLPPPSMVRSASK